MNQYVSTEDEHQVVRWSSLAKNKVSIVTKPLSTMAREPGELFFGQPLQIFDSAQSRYDLSEALINENVFRLRIHRFHHLYCSLSISTLPAASPKTFSQMSPLPEPREVQEEDRGVMRSIPTRIPNVEA